MGRKQPDSTVIYSASDDKRISNLEKMKELAFESAKQAHNDPSKKQLADQRMSEYLKEAAECALLGTALVTRENGQVTKIWNYLQDVKWFAHAPGEQTQYGTYRGLLMLFDKVRYDGDTVTCKDTLGSGDNFRYLTDRVKGIKHHGAGEYEMDKDQFVPLKLITPPLEIKVGDYFFATAFGKGGTQFKPIQSFSSNPWSDEIDSFVCNSSYSMRRAFGSRCSGRIHMLQSDDKLKELLKNSALWI